MADQSETVQQAAPQVAQPGLLAQAEAAATSQQVVEQPRPLLNSSPREASDPVKVEQQEAKEEAAAAVEGQEDAARDDMASSGGFASPLERSEKDDQEEQLPTTQPPVLSDQQQVKIEATGADASQAQPSNQVLIENDADVRTSTVGYASEGENPAPLLPVVKPDLKGAPSVRLIVSTTRSPRVFALRTLVSSFDQIIARKLPQLQDKIQASDADLFHMTTALATKKALFEQAFITVKQETEQESSDQPNPQTVAYSERLDLIYIRDTDKLIECLTKTLPMDLEAFFDFFQWNFSLQKTSFTLSLAQFITIYIQYIETQHQERKQGKSHQSKPFLRASDSMTEEYFKKYIFGESYLDGQDLIVEKLEQSQAKIQELFAEISPETPGQICLGSIKEFWLRVSLLTRCVMTKAGTEYKLGQRLSNDQECLGQLHEHLCLTHYLAKREQNQAKGDMKSIIRTEGNEWPRELVQQKLNERASDESIIKPKVIQFADEAAFKPNLDVFDDQIVSTDFVLKEVVEFFQTRRSVVLVDLDALEAPKNEDQPMVKEEVTLQPVPTEKQQEPTVKIVKKKTNTYEEDDDSYVPPPSSLPEALQKAIDKNLLEVFTFYSRKFASVRGDFNQLTQNLAELGLQGYTKFCRDFKMPLSSSEITTVWKKSSVNHQPHEFEQFQKSIAILGVASNLSQTSKSELRQKMLKQEAKRRRKAEPTTDDQAVGKQAQGPPPSTKTSLEKMSDAELSGELVMLRKQIGRASLLSEDQCRIQMYTVLQIQFPDKYRQKLPTYGQNELNSNILLTKKLIAAPDQSSNAGGASSAKISSVSSIVARLTSNPPPQKRERDTSKPAFVKEVQKAPLVPRGRTQNRPQSLLSPQPGAQSMKALELKNQKPLESKPTHGAAFQRKQTECGDESKRKPPIQEPISKTRETVSTTRVPDTIPVVDRKERQNLAQIHKRIREEKQKTGRVLTVAEAKLLIAKEALQAQTGSPSKQLSRQTSKEKLLSKRSTDRSSSKILPLNKINQSKRVNPSGLASKTPSMIDLVSLKTQADAKDLPSQAHQAQLVGLPQSLTFDDIQKMHYSNLNKGAASQEDEFRPQDFLDIDSGDSDNEILAKFKPENPASLAALNGKQVFNIMQPSSPTRQQFMPPYLLTSNTNIEEQTGYSNSPKFSIYRLNNQSNLKDAPPTGFGEQVSSLAANPELGSHNQDASHLYEQQNEYFPAASSADEILNPKTGSQSSTLGNNSKLVKQRNSVNNSRLRRHQQAAPVQQKSKRTVGQLNSLPITTPQGQKQKSLLRKTPQQQSNKMVAGRSANLGLNSDYSGGNTGLQNADIFQSHGSLPFQGQETDYIPSGSAGNAPKLNINENISEINIHDRVGPSGKPTHDDQTTTNGVLSIFNENQRGIHSPQRLPAHQILEDGAASIKSKRASEMEIGDGIAQLGNRKDSSRQNLQLGSARISGSKHTKKKQGGQQASSKRLGQLNVGKRGAGIQQATSHNQGMGKALSGVNATPISQSIAQMPRYTTDQKANPNMNSHLNLHLSSNFTEQHLSENALPLNEAFQTPSNQAQSMPGQRRGPGGVPLPQSSLPQSIGRGGESQAHIDSSHKTNEAGKSSAVSGSNQRALMRAQEAQKKQDLNKKRRMDGLMSLHEQNLQKGLNTAGRK